jgi:HNH endonuclease
VGGPRAGHHRQGRRPALGPGRAGVVPAPPAAWGARLGGPTLPLDIGFSETVPAGIRNAVILRDKHCRWAGECRQPAAAYEVHHVKHKANGGKTSTKDCVLLCFFHHQVMIHRQGWTLVLNPHGTAPAWNKNKTEDLAKLSGVRSSET